MSSSVLSNFTSCFSSHCFKNSKKETLIKAFDKVNADTRIASTSFEFDRVLDQVNEMDRLYHAYLNTHCCFKRIIIVLCWWKSSATGSYLSCRRNLVGRVAAGYENKMITLLACKYFLGQKSHRNFCSEVLEQAITNTHRKKDVHGFVWKVTNSKGVTNYLIGTIHQGTKAMGQAKGIVKAIESSEKFFTELGLLNSWKSPYASSMDSRFPFHMDVHIALEASKRKKPIFALDNIKLEKATIKAVEEIRKNQSSTTSKKIDFSKEAPSAKYFVSPQLKFDSNHPIIGKKFWKIVIYQYFNLWQKGDQSELIEFAKQIESDDSYALADLRTKAWLKNSYKSNDSEKALPGLIRQIQDANKPICIAVGTSHCFGSKISLVEEFKNAGFEVSRFE